MKIRKAKKSDFDSILNLQLQLEDAEIVFDKNLKKHVYATEEGKKRLMKRISKRKTIFLVYENDNKEVIGFIDGYILDSADWYKEEVSYLDHLVVDKKYRQQGIAGELMNEFERISKEKGAKYVRVLAFPNNSPAVSCYHNKGYVEYSTYYNKKID